MKKLIGLLSALVLFAGPARADNFGADMSFTAASAAGTNVVYTTPTEIGMYTTCSIYTRTRGVTGGTLDIFVQTSFRGVNTTPIWADVAHMPQLAAGAVAVGSSFTLTRFSAASAVVTATLNTVDGTPALPVNTVVNGFLGMKLRVIAVTGAGTSAGAVQNIYLYCSST